jgi:hypothetical protein
MVFKLVNATARSIAWGAPLDRMRGRCWSSS